MFKKEDFEILPWQLEYLHWWQKLALANKLPQALLLVAPLGYGKFNLACKFAQLTFCKNLAKNIDCNYCTNCKLVLSANYPDLLLLEPKGKNILIEQVRSILDFVNQSGARTSRKVIIVKKSEALNINSANAMLKILEEPPQGTTFLFLAEKPKLLPATIVSRLQILELEAPDAKLVSDWLEKQGVKDGAQKLLQNFNAPFLALNKTSESYQQEQIILTGLQKILFKQESPLVVAAQIPANLDLKLILELIQRHINNFWRYMILNQLKDASLENFYQKLAEKSFSKHLLEFYSELNLAVEHLARNPNRQLLLENIFIKFEQSLKKT